jgi:hypothetical protein
MFTGFSPANQTTGHIPVEMKRDEREGEAYLKTQIAPAKTPTCIPNFQFSKSVTIALIMSTVPPGGGGNAALGPWRPLDDISWLRRLIDEVLCLDVRAWGASNRAE